MNLANVIRNFSGRKSIVREAPTITSHKEIWIDENLEGSDDLILFF